MVNRFNMSREENVFWAKRNLVDSIFKSAKLEGLNVTYPETQVILDGLGVKGVPFKDALAINNMKNAWYFLLDDRTLDYQTNYALICELNKLVGDGQLIINAGALRSVPVRMGGTSWTPELPNEFIVKEKLHDVLSINSDTERAINLMLYLIRGQLFLDGNKRTAMLAANHVMVSHGAGIISIDVEDQKDFYELLVRYYETNDSTVISDFIYRKCIDGIHLEQHIEDDLSL